VSEIRWLRRTAVLLLVVATGCGESRSAAVNDRPAIEETLRSFYKAVIEDRDFSAACRYTSARFALRPALYVGGNINAQREATLQRQRAARKGGRPRTCKEMARTIFDARGDQYPFYGWYVESVVLAEDGLTAEVVTSDGSAGLEKVDGKWLMLWAFDAAP